MKRRVVITGIGIITALGIGAEKNWAHIKSGKSGIRAISSFDPRGYRGKTGGEVGEFTAAPFRVLKEKRLDRASHLLICAVREALSSAGIIHDLREMQVLLSLGTTLGGMISGEAFHIEALEKGPGRARLSLLSDYLADSQSINLFKEFELKGDFLVFSNACASGANGIGHAYRAVRHGEYTTAICGGYDTMSEFTFAGFNSLMAVTPSICRPFDKNRDGLVLGEGAGILVIEDLDRALGRGARILGEIAGYGESSDAYHMTGPEPSGDSAARAIVNAWAEADNVCIDYINAHGTATKYNDLMETRAIMTALGSAAPTVPVSSTKPLTGHLLGGAGAIEAIISLLAIIHKTFPPTLNYETPDPECDLNIVTEATEGDVRTALSNSFGFGGSNAALILKEYP